MANDPAQGREPRPSAGGAAWIGRRVLVTGATGFLGSHLTRRLVDRGADVHAWAGSSVHLGRLADLEPKLHVARVDLRDADGVATACRDALPDVVYHLAAYGVHSHQRDMDVAFAVNVKGTFHLLSALRGTSCRRVVSTGTWAEYASQGRPLFETDPIAPASTYGTTKAMATLLALDMAAQEGLPLLVLRPFSVYGPGEETNKFVPAVIDACLRGESPRLTSCRQVRDYLHIDDLLDAYECAADVSLQRPSVVNVASGQGITLRDMALAIVKEIGEIPIQFGALPDRDREVWHVQASITKAETLLGWRPKRSLRDGIRATIAWYAERLRDERRAAMKAAPELEPAPEARS